MFGYMIDDTPMLFVKKAGADVTMLNGHFEQGSFTLKDWNEWGFRVPTDKLGKSHFYGPSRIHTRMCLECISPIKRRTCFSESFY